MQNKSSKMNIIIFGCGVIGTQCFYKLSRVYSVVAWTDNNERLWGTYKEGIKIIPPSEIADFVKMNSAEIFVGVENGNEIVKQLTSYGLRKFYIYEPGLMFREYNSRKPLLFLSENTYSYCTNEHSFLFVVYTFGSSIREHKMAAILKEKGYHVSIAVLTFRPKDGWEQYENIYDYILPIISVDDICSFVNESNFEYLVVRGRADYLTAILTTTNRTVIHHCHDLGSAYLNMSTDELIMEYIAFTQSDGVIFPSEALRQLAIQKYGLIKDRTYVINNYVSQLLKQEKRLEKISKIDGQIHCVYEGGVSHNKDGDFAHRFFENIWIKIAEAGVHVHFYTASDEKYCRKLESLHSNIHYEGNRTSKELAVEMSKYDVGLIVWNITEKNKRYLEWSSPNKISEYVNAGIPIAVSDINSQRKFAEDNGFGKCLDLNGDIYRQIKEIAEIEIPQNALHEKGLTFENQMEMFVDFCKELRG